MFDFDAIKLQYYTPPMAPDKATICLNNMHLLIQEHDRQIEKFTQIRTMAQELAKFLHEIRIAARHPEPLANLLHAAEKRHCRYRTFKIMKSELLLAQAISLAAAAHEGQLDLVGEAMILHPLRVMFRLRKQEKNIEIQMAAVLHDVIEDSTWSGASLRSLFGDKVSNLVVALSRRNGESYDDYISRIISEGSEASEIKLTDILDNMMRLPALREMDMQKADRLESKYRPAMRALYKVLRTQSFVNRL